VGENIAHLKKSSQKGNKTRKDADLMVEERVCRWLESEVGTTN
jgi:hypothetical protein